MALHFWRQNRVRGRLPRPGRRHQLVHQGTAQLLLPSGHQFCGLEEVLKGHLPGGRGGLAPRDRGADDTHTAESEAASVHQTLRLGILPLGQASCQQPEPQPTQKALGQQPAHPPRAQQRETSLLLHCVPAGASEGHWQLPRATLGGPFGPARHSTGG